MNINDLTIGQAKELASLFGVSQTSTTLNSMVGAKCIIRTYSAGVWFGEISEKAGNEVIVLNARRLWRWQTQKSISLSAIAMGDIDESKCRIAQAVHSVWLEAIELIPAAKEAIKIIEGAKIDVAS
jgi:hypothetical protein